MLALGAFTFYMFRLSRKRLPHSEFCRLTSVFLSPFSRHHQLLLTPEGAASCRDKSILFRMNIHPVAYTQFDGSFFHGFNGTVG